MKEIIIRNRISKKTIAHLQLLFVALGWATSTILIKLYITELPAFHFMMARFFLATAFILMTSFDKVKKIQMEDIKIGSFLGILTFIAYSLSVICLKYTTASKSGFLVALPVLFIPIIETAIRKKTPSKYTVISVILSLVGLRLISGLNGSGFNIGDGLALGVAITYTLYIILLDRFGNDRDAFVLTFVQLSVVTIASSIGAYFEGFNLPQLYPNFVPILFIGIFSTGISLLLQTKAQKVASSESVGIILLGEPLFTLLMAYFILQEKILLGGLIGAILLLLSLIIAIIKKI
ncbi:DMT family transporter [Clostridium sp.]|uniref:DMT family transporter n=1 Tax=Clostridium sp. TaxID=1506 RepID=UPI001A3E291B|nr:DMT family transporter [Clostridium sp.]MBK5240342.1 DMT family transporter [Clostridium sp.]